MNWFRRLKNGLLKTAQTFSSNLQSILGSTQIDQAMIEQIEELLISTDLGLDNAHNITKKLSHLKSVENESLEITIKKYISDEIAEILHPYAGQISLFQTPSIILLCGVNGSGKTTTAGKLATQFTYGDKKTVILAACDTFRAAATEQLQLWGRKINCEVVTGDALTQDPASIAYKAVMSAIAKKIDVVIIDTAGRLHNNHNLMLELEKIIRVIKKINPIYPEEILMIIDGTTGQNALQQIDIFRKTINLSGIIVTKLDGASKGGIVVTLSQKYKIPIKAIGVGEDIEDLNNFHPKEFANNLVGLE